MNEWERSVREHLATASDAPWQWVDDARVLTWEDGETIAFRAEVEAILTRVARELDVIPPLGSVALLIAATRGPERGVLDPARVERVGIALARSASGEPSALAASEAFAQMVVALRVLGRIGAPFWDRRDAREIIAVRIFEHGRLVRDPIAARRLISALERGLGPESCGAPEPGAAGEA